jgi:predicted  nucleic acid-binding Zn-ribbon protein
MTSRATLAHRAAKAEREVAWLESECARLEKLIAESQATKNAHERQLNDARSRVLMYRMRLRGARR